METIESTSVVHPPTVSPQAKTLTEKLSSSQSMVCYSLKGAEIRKTEAHLCKEKDAPPYPQLST